MKITRTPNLADGKTYGLSEGEFTNLPSPRDRPRPGPTTHNPLCADSEGGGEHVSGMAAQERNLSPTFSLSYEKF